jgi:cytochrome c-type biogenesis protein CcmF
MTALTGQTLLAIALLGCAATVASGWRAAHGEPVGVALRWAPRIAVGAALAAFVTLVGALLADDFSVQFVAEHHSRTTSTAYSITAAWSGLEGSLLLWAVVICVYMAVVGRRVAAGRDDRLGAGALVVMGVVGAFFVGVVLLVKPAFRTIVDPPSDGLGGNALLQDNVMMAIHPPLLYLGYVGFMVPFAFALSALAQRERGPRWVLRTQTWTVVAWMFLTAGIVIGGWWSYGVLGWGGYWAWDPVENASFLPWLAGTAYLHSAVLQARRGMLPAWSVALVISTFLYTLLGTFLARSGVIASVHAFSESNLGPVLLGFLVVAVAVSGWLFTTRLGDVVTGPSLRSLASREGAFLANNLLLSLFAVVVLIGTAYPIVIEALDGERISVGRPFFDVFAVWIGLALLTVMAVGVVTPYRRAGWSVVWTRLRLSVQIGLATAAAAVLAGLRQPFVIVTLLLASTIAATAIRELISGARQRLDHRGAVTATVATLRAGPGFWGGQVAHIGLAVVALGIATTGGMVERATVQLTPGDSKVAAGFTVTYLAPAADQRGSFTAKGAQLRLSRNGRSAQLTPWLRQYPSRREAVGVPAVWTAADGTDGYAALRSLGEEGATVEVYRYPGMVLLWTGGLLCAAGGATSLALRELRRRGERAVVLAGLADPDSDAPQPVESV